MEVSDGKVVSIYYTLKDMEGNILDSSEADSPFSFIQGTGEIVEGLEKALYGKTAGDNLNLVVEPKEGYGEKDESLIQIVDENDFQGVDKLEEGMSFQAETDDGVKLFHITEINGSKVTVDMNHPLAGETLTFDVEVTEVREATTEEQSSGHVHGEKSCSCCCC